MSRVSEEEVWDRLFRGASLDDCGLAVTDGRYELGGLSLPRPELVERYRLPRVKILAIEGRVDLRGVRWTSLDFTGAKLASLRFIGCAIENCRFTRSSCRDWRLWDSAVTQTRFEGSDLRESVLGPVSENGSRNSYRSVVFDHSDLRGTMYQSCDFEDCSFLDCNLRRVEFEGAVFRRCVFAGRLEEVTFQRYMFRGERLPPNCMEDVDLSRATLRMVDFRNADLEQVRWPVGNDYVVVHDVRAALQKGVSFLSRRQDLAARVMASLLQHQLKWTGESQKTGLINRADLATDGGVELAEQVIAVMLDRDL